MQSLRHYDVKDHITFDGLDIITVIMM